MRFMQPHNLDCNFWRNAQRETLHMRILMR
jgi:hypothetical protein